MMYIYMLSPKDAFRQWNQDRTGKLSFEDFQKMIRQLYSCTSEPVPSFAVTKDLFNYFDKRRDGFIDQKEWLETFKRIEVPIKSEYLQHIVLNPNGAAYSRYELSDEFDRAVRAINKNRKYIIENLSQVEAAGKKVDFKVVRAFLESFLRTQRIEVDPKIWKLLIGFAERDLGKVDYRYMLDKYRERSTNMLTYPLLGKSQSAKAVEPLRTNV